MTRVRRFDFKPLGIRVGFVKGEFIICNIALSITPPLHMCISLDLQHLLDLLNTMTFYFLEYLRRNCMHVFHYLASVLKDVPLWEMEAPHQTDGDLGSIYNGFDGRAIWEDNQTTMVVLPPTPDVEEDVPCQNMFPDGIIDFAYLAADEEDPVRCTYDTPLFDNCSDINSSSYHNKVLNSIYIYIPLISPNLQ